MQTQQVHGILPSSLYAPKNASAKATDTSFDKLLQMQNTQNPEVTEAAKAEPKTKDTSAANVKKPEQTKQSDNVETAVTRETVTDKKQAEETGTADQLQETDTEAMEKAAALLERVTELVKDVLKLSEDELKQLLEQLGITAADLSNPMQLQTLILTVNSCEEVALITNAELLGQLKELTTEVERLFDEAGITPEEFKAVLGSPEFEAFLEEISEQAGEAVTSEAGEEKTETDEKQFSDELTATENEKKTTTVEFKQDTENSTEDNSITAHAEAAAETKAEKNGAADQDAYAVQFLQNLQKAAEEIMGVSGEKLDIAQMIREIADQILEKVKITVTPEITSLDIVLTPEELGKVNLTVASEADGTMKASFVTENELAKEAIERNLVQFKEALNEQGLKVDSIEVTVANFSFDKDQAGQSSAQEEKKDGKHRFLSDEAIGQPEETDQIAQHFMDGGESTVNYMA